MDSDELIKLRQYYHSLLGQQRILNGISGELVEYTSIKPLDHELRQLNEEFSSLMPPFNIQDYYSHTQSTVSGGETIFDLIAIQSYIAMALGRLQIDIEQTTDIPVIEKRQFTFISNTNLRTIIERDYAEIQKAYLSQCWKSVIILCGGAIEAILTDLLKLNEPAAKSAESAPNKPNITRWDLSELISVVVELKLVTAGIEKFSPSLREYRNLVHPGNEIRTHLYFGAEEARIAVEILNILHRDLSK